MKNINGQDVLARLRELQTAFYADLPSRLKLIEIELRKVSDEVCDSATIENLHSKVHSLIGSAGTFGAPQISRAARLFDDELKSLFNTNNISAEKYSNLHKLYSHFVEVVNATLSEDMLELTVPQGKSRRMGEVTIYLVDDDAFLRGSIEASLASAGYLVKAFGDVAEFVRACAKVAPDAIVMDMVFAGNSHGGADAIVKASALLDSPPPVIFVSQRNDAISRLYALRAGATRYFTKPVDIEKLIATLDGLTDRKDVAPFRVLAIDDDESLLQYYESFLGSENIRVRMLSEPMRVLEEIADFRPDLLLLDVHMPEVSGLELASMIRQDDEFALLPIVFLSSESDILTQMHALDLGGDAFITKPVNPEHLLLAVNARLKRSRWVNRLNTELQTALTESRFKQVVLDKHGIYSVADVNGTIIDVNDMFCEISGYSRQELLGNNHRLVKSGEQGEAFYQQLWDTISHGRIWRGEICNRAKDGSLYWVDSTIVPFLDADGLPYKYVSLRTDVTQLKRKSAALEESEKRLRRSQTFANIGTWDWNVQTGELFWSERIAPLFGYLEGTLETTYENFLAAVHPDDREQLVNAVTNCVENGAEYNIEHRCVWPDGSVRWLHERGDVVRDEAGKPLHMLGVVQDITERKQMSLRLDQQSMLLNVLRIGMGKFIAEADFSATADYFLQSLMALTGSAAGFCGEVLRTEDGAQYLKLNSISNITLSDAEFSEVSFTSENNSCYYNLDTLFGYAIKASQRIMFNNYEHGVKSNGVRVRGEDVTSYLGVPVFYGEKLVGLYGIANRPEGYDEAMADFLRPFNATYGSILHAKNMMELERKIQQDLVLAKEEAESASRAKSEFLSSMSHELRTPMNAILGFGQLLEIDDELSQYNIESVQEILKAGHHLLELINEVLDLSRIESGSITLSMESVDLTSLLTECVTLISPQAVKANVSLKLELMNYSCLVHADRMRLKQVIINLISNAIKYNRSGGWVRIYYTAQASGRVRLSVEDSGVGISEKHQAGLFKSFNRLGAENSDIEGTGIGLVITRNIVELMGGEIGFSTKEGVGSLFWVELTGSESSEVFAGKEKALPFVEKVAQTKNIPILYVDDNPANLKLVERALAAHPSYIIYTAEDYDIAKPIIREIKPRLILMDLNLPGISGYDALDDIRAVPDFKDVPIFAVSAKAFSADIEYGLKRGFNEYVTKPLDIATLVRKIDQYVGESPSIADKKD